MSKTVFDLVHTACVLEATAIKAGNVHPAANFKDTSFQDFLNSANLVRIAFLEHSDAPIGVWIYESVRIVQEKLGKNTNLGIILLLAPLAKAALLVGTDFRSTIPTHTILGGLSGKDASLVYKAIALANPGGLGKSEDMDVHGTAPKCLISAMQLAADYDDVAKQYVTNFSDVYEMALRLAKFAASEQTLFDAVRRLQIERLSKHIDTLILRKCGMDLALEVQHRALKVMESGPYGSQIYNAAWSDFDCFLRSDGNRMNPGTTADLIAAAIFIFLLQNPNIYDTISIPS